MPKTEILAIKPLDNGSFRMLVRNPTMALPGNPFSHEVIVADYAKVHGSDKVVVSPMIGDEPGHHVATIADTLREFNCE